MLCKQIESLTNRKVKNIVSLRNRSQRIESGLTIVEGVREITRLLESGISLKELYVSQGFRGCHIPATSSRNVSWDLIKEFTKRNVPVYETSKSVFSKISYGNKTEGVLALCAPKVKELSSLPLKKHPFFVVIESVEKPGNLGAILRTCDGAGVDGIIICEGKTDIYNPNVIRSSLGAVFSLNIAVASNEEAFQFFKKNKVNVCAALLDAKNIYTNEELKKGVAVVVGSEQNGLSEFWSQNADCKIRIPMKGKVDSLNVSAATAIVLYEIIRQRS